jgi:hypothetical protein
MASFRASFQLQFIRRLRKVQPMALKRRSRVEDIMSQKTLIPAALAFALFAAAAPPSLAAEANPKIASAFGNTVFSIYPDGRSQKIWLKEDGTWTGQSRRGNPLAGKWTAKGDQVCMKQTSPPMFGFSFCQAFPDDPMKGVDAKDFTGTKIHLKLVKGHVTKTDG